MADEPEDDVLDLGEIADEQQQNEPGDEPEEFVLEGEEDDAEETPVIKRMRETIRERDRRIAELSKQAPQRQEIVVGDKPTLESCEWDEARYDRERDAYEGRKLAKERQDRERTDAETEANRQLERERSEFKAKAAKLPVKDFDEAERVVDDGLPVIMRQAIYRYMPNPAETVYALGKRPARLAAIAAETDAIKQLLMLKEVSQGVKIVPKVKKPPEPEQVVRGSAPIAKVPEDKKLAQLQKEARATNDRTALLKYQREKARR